MKNKVSTICFWVFVSLILVYLAASIVPSVFSSEGITVEPAEAITYDDSLYVTGIALRDETFVTSAEKLTSIDYKVSDGDRVSLGDIVAVYSNGNISAGDRLSVEAIDRQIKILNQSLFSTSQYDLKTLDSHTKDSIRNFLDVQDQQNISSSLNASSTVISHFIERDIKASGDKDYYKQILQNCESARNTIMSGNSAQQYTVKSSRAGYFSSRFDGYEALKAEDFATITPSALNTLLNKSPENRPQNYVGKLQHFSFWNFLCNVPEGDAERFEIGTSWLIRFDTAAYGIQNVSMTVRNVSSPEDGMVSVVFECSFFNEALYSLRICDAQIILKSYSGFRIKKDSVRISEGQSGVYVLSGAKLVFKPIDVLYRNETSDFVVVLPDTEDASRTLILNDAVVVGGKEIYDGKVVNIN